MVYKLDKADQRCDVTYVDWSKKYSPIPKATCDMIQPKCSSGGGSYTDDAVELKCEDLKKLIHGEEKPKEEKEEPREDTPKENTPTEGNTEVNLLELMPTVEDKFSEVAYTPDNIVKTVIHDTSEEKVAFENKIITALKSKLPEGATVEAVLSEPFYKEGSEHLQDKTNYTLNVRVTLKGKVYEQVYNVPHIQAPLVAIVNNI